MVLDVGLPARIRQKARNQGVWGLVAFALHRLDLTPQSWHPIYKLKALYAQHPLWVRCRTSGIGVFEQVFVEREYACLDDVPSVEVIIDLGANVGYSCAYFLSRWPRTTLIAVEPDEDNVAMLEPRPTGR